MAKRLAATWHREMSRERVKPGSTRVVPDKTKRGTDCKNGTCGHKTCQTCTEKLVWEDDAFFESVCNEVEGVEPIKH